jgi:hypothetical protein
MKHTQSIVLVFAFVAAVLGIYYAQAAPFTHIAAAAVLVATIVGIFQALRAADEAAFVKQTLSHLARSVPPSDWWKDKIKTMIQQISVEKGYILGKILFDSSNPKDPEANCIFLFRSEVSHTQYPNGILVLTPADYAQLSTIGEKDLAKAVQCLVFGEWGTNSNSDATHRISETAIALYSLSRIHEGFGVRISSPADSMASLIVELGSTELSFDSITLNEILKLPPILRDLKIAEVVSEADPKLSPYLT